MKARHPLRLDGLHPGRHPRGAEDAPETLLIVVVVIFLFLGSLRSVLIPWSRSPSPSIGAVFLMLAAGFTINLLTLLAIVLSVGLVVDDAIVMVENVERHLHEGKSRSRPRSRPRASWWGRSSR